MFRNYSGINEPAFATPIGTLSIRNGLVFAFFGMFSFMLSKLILPLNIEFPQGFGIISDSNHPDNFWIIYGDDKTTNSYSRHNNFVSILHVAQ